MDTESNALANTSVPHIIPILSLLERGMAVGEALEPWESAEVGVDVVMYHLEAARTMAHHGGIYRSNTETKLQGKCDARTVASRMVTQVNANVHSFLQPFTPKLFGLRSLIRHQSSTLTFRNSENKPFSLSFCYIS